MRSRTKGQGDLAPEEAARATAALLRLRDERCDGSVTALARLLAVSQPALSLIFLGQSSPSYAMAAAAAEQLGVPVGVLLAADADDEIPARARALARLDGLLPPRVVETVRSVDVHADWDERTWMRFALARLEDYEMSKRVKSDVPSISSRRKTS
jgi:transcriptional regulator with XRE-family HTH domain